MGDSEYGVSRDDGMEVYVLFILCLVRIKLGARLLAGIGWIVVMGWGMGSCGG